MTIVPVFDPKTTLIFKPTPQEQFLNAQTKRLSYAFYTTFVWKYSKTSNKDHYVNNSLLVFRPPLYIWPYVEYLNHNQTHCEDHFNQIRFYWSQKWFQIDYWGFTANEFFRPFAFVSYIYVYSGLAILRRVLFKILVCTLLQTRTCKYSNFCTRFIINVTEEAVL